MSNHWTGFWTGLLNWTARLDSGLTLNLMYKYYTTSSIWDESRLCYDCM